MERAAVPGESRDGDRKGIGTKTKTNAYTKSQECNPNKRHLHLHLSHLADALIQSDLQIGAFTL
jgi:hypothetical protein